MKKAIIVILFITLLLIVWGVSGQRCKVIRITEPQRLLSPIELQQELNRRNPDYQLVEDGIIGPLTINAWQAEADK